MTMGFGPTEIECLMTVSIAQICKMPSLALMDHIVSRMEHITNSLFPFSTPRFLQVLEIIVQEPGSAFRTYLPNIISICMEHVYPIIAEVGYLV